MMYRLSVLIALLATSSTHVAAQEPSSLSMEQAVAIALARNHDVIAAKLQIKSAEFDRVEAELYPNPVLGYSLGNLVVGAANPQGSPPVHPGVFGQTVHTVSLSEVIDIWGKRRGRIQVARRSLEVRQWQVRDLIREITYTVRSAFASVVREQAELALSRETRARYDETTRLSRARFEAGDVSDAELKKVELEGLRYQNAEIEAQMELDLAREQLAALLALRSASELPESLVEADKRQRDLTLPRLLEHAYAERPDILAAKEAQLLSGDAIALAKRVAYPDLTVALQYTHSQFTISGDNPNALGAGISMPLPIFDRNQADIGRARVEREFAENEGKRLLLEVRHDVTESYRRIQRSQTLLDVFEGKMLARAEAALTVAEKSYQAGNSSLLELLEAQRTHIETKAEYLRVVYEYQQALIDMTHAVGGELKS